MSASGRQLLPASCAASGEHPTAPGGLHPGAEAVLLGAMALLRLVGLLHRVSWSSTVRPQGYRSFRPQKARRRAVRTEAKGTSTPRDYGRSPPGCQTRDARSGAGHGSQETRGWRPQILPGGMLLWVPVCLAGAVGAVLPCVGPRSPGRLRATSGRRRRPPRSGSVSLLGSPAVCRFSGSWSSSGCPGAGQRVAPGPGAQSCRVRPFGYTSHLARGPR